MQPIDPTMPPSGDQPFEERCTKHPNVVTGLHCTRCGRPICTDCMIPAPVGYHCPECVAEARSEFRAADPTRSVRVAAKKATASVTKAILAILAIIFIAEVVLSSNIQPSNTVLFDMGALFPPSIALDGQAWRLFAAMWLHGSIIHIGLNAYFLWIFGPVVEDQLGKIRFVLLYLVAGLAGSTVSYAFGEIVSLGVGASGAIMGVFGAFLAINFRARHRSAVAAAQLRQGLIIIMINIVFTLAQPGIDWRAHLGGIVAGFLAGYAAEGIGSSRHHRKVEAMIFAAILLVSVLLAMNRTDQIKQQVFQDGGQLSAQALPAGG